MFATGMVQQETLLGQVFQKLSSLSSTLPYVTEGELGPAPYVSIAFVITVIIFLLLVVLFSPPP